MQDGTLIDGAVGIDHHVTVESGPDGHDPFALTAPTIDLDGDGLADTSVFADADGTTIATDLDGDGFADHLTRVEEDGGYAAWEPHRDADGIVHWEQTDHGAL